MVFGPRVWGRLSLQIEVLVVESSSGALMAAWSIPALMAGHCNLEKGG